MRGFADIQRAFAGAVLYTDAAVPTPVSRKEGGVPSRRFGVYRNNVYASLIDVLAGRFPVVARLVGEESSALWPAPMSRTSRRARPC